MALTILFIVQVLKQREDEIDHLENNLKIILPPNVSPSSLRSDAVQSPTGPEGRSLAVSPADARPSSRTSGASQLDAVPESVTDEEVQTRRMEDLLRLVLPGCCDSTREADFRARQSPRSMAQMETSHKETVEALSTELAKTKRDHSDLVALSRDQVRTSLLSGLLVVPLAD